MILTQTTPTPSPTVTETVTASPTATPTVTASPTATPTVTATETVAAAPLAFADSEAGPYLEAAGWAVALIVFLAVSAWFVSMSRGWRS